MQWRKASKSDGPTENAPYPRCHEKAVNAGDWVFINFDDEVFNSSTSFAVVTVRESLTARCT